MERIGIYGGTFNPPHIGHIRAAEYAVESLQLTKLLMIPSCISPHKKLPQNSPTPEQRMEMLQLAVGNDEKIEISDLELRRGSTSYTYETVAQLRKDYPALRLGEIAFFEAGDKHIGFTRTYEDKTLRIYVNRSADSWEIRSGKIVLGYNLQLVSGDSLTLGPRGFMILED